jgi:hypothetical protein
VKPPLTQRTLRSPEPDAAGMRERMDAIRLRALLAPETLTEQDQMCLQMEHPACPSCGGVR